MKVYVLISTGYEDSELGPIFGTREAAEGVLERLGGDWEIEERDVLDSASRVTMHYAQRYAREPGTVRTGTREWWDYETADLPRGQWIAWAETEEQARELLLSVPV